MAGKKKAKEPKGMTVETARFVLMSDVFFGNNIAKNLFEESEHEFTWGDANRTLITPQKLIADLTSVTKALEEDAELEEDGEIGECNNVIEILRSIPEDVYVDLEN